jgi:imidazolonepropionase-like amidohydrolase
LGPSRRCVVAIKASLVVDAATGPPTENGVVVVWDKKIEVIRPWGRLKVPNSCEVIDFARQTRLPGRFDRHGKLPLTYVAKGASAVAGLFYQELARGGQQMVYRVTNARAAGEKGFGRYRRRTVDGDDHRLEAVIASVKTCDGRIAVFNAISPSLG